MKVLFISHEASRTGAPLVLLSLLKSIKKEFPQIEAHLLLRQGGELMDEFEQCAKIVRLHRKKSLWQRAKRKILRNKHPYQLDLEQLNTTGYDCIFANSMVSLPLAITLKNELLCPLILYVHEASFQIKAIGTSLSNIYKCDKIIVASELVKQAIVNEYGVDPTQMLVVYPHTDNIPINTVPTATPTPSYCFTIGLSGAGSWNKGVDILPYVIKECEARHPDFNCHFIWVGDIPNDIRTDLIPCTEKHKLTITGVVESPIEYYRQFDVFLLLSREESFSLASVENIQLGKPVVCMDGAVGITDMVGRDAMVVVPYLSVVSIADALYRLATDKEQYTTISNKAFARMTERYSRHDFMQSITNTLFTTAGSPQP